MSEIVKGITVGEFNETLSLLPGGKDNVAHHGESLERWFRTLAEKHSRKVLEDFINDHFPEDSKVNVTCRGNYVYTTPIDLRNVFDSPKSRESEAYKEYGRVYSDLEQGGDKGSPAKNLANPSIVDGLAHVESIYSAMKGTSPLNTLYEELTKPETPPANLDLYGCNEEGCYVWGKFIKGVTYGEVEELWGVARDAGFIAFLEEFKELAETHAKERLEGFIDDHFPADSRDLYTFLESDGEEECAPLSVDKLVDLIEKIWNTPTPPKSESTTDELIAKVRAYSSHEI